MGLFLLIFFKFLVLISNVVTYINKGSWSSIILRV